MYHASSQTAIGTSAAPTTTTGQTQALSVHRAERPEGRLARATARSNRFRSRRAGIPVHQVWSGAGPGEKEKCFYWVRPRIEAGWPGSLSFLPVSVIL
jgi:hypothetical protein